MANDTTDFLPRRRNGHTPPEERFWERVMPEPNSGCWLWNGAICGHMTPSQSRPVLTVGGKAIKAYRFAYELLVGPIPDGKFICHKCDVPLCVNPDHLYVGDASTNGKDMAVRMRHPNIANPAVRAARIKRLIEGPRAFKIPKTALPAILASRRRGETYKQIAKRYGVTRCAISQFIARNSPNYFQGVA